MIPRPLAVLIALSLFLTLATAGWGVLYNETDGQYGGAAKVMATGGSWVIPENNAIPRLVKPPLLYWAMAASMKVFGVNEFAARLPNALAIMCWVAVTFLIGAHFAGPRRGFVAGAILLTGLGTWTLGRIIMPEPLFSALIAAALYCGMRLCEMGASRWWARGFWLCAALASFTKGWHGAMYPFAIVGMAAFFSPGWHQAFRRLLVWEAPALFLGINLPWHLAIEHRFPGYFHNLVFVEILGHVSGSKAPATGYTNVPRLQFLALHFAWFFPWSVMALGGLIAGHGRAARESPSNPGGSTVPHPLADPPAGPFLLAWAGVILGSVLLAGSRQDYYAMSMWPTIALAAAALLERPIPRWVVAALAVLVFAGFLAALNLPGLAGAGSAAGVADRSTAWTTVTQFDSSVWRSVRATALLALGFAAAACAVAWLIPAARRFEALLAAAIAIALGAVSGTALVAPWFSLGPVRRELAAAAPIDVPIVFEGDIDTASSLLFYSDRKVILLGPDPGSDFTVRQYGIGRDRFIDEAGLIARWSASTLLVVESARVPYWRGKLVPEPVEFARCGTLKVLGKAR